jgi:FkbM family methyltransferase
VQVYGRFVHELVWDLLRRAMAALWGALRLNAFVYNACLLHRVKYPDIPVRPVELYGQCGEDLIVLSLLEARALSEGIDLKRKSYLEIGGNHSFATSATYLLNKRLGMRGVIVEANANLIADLKKGRPEDIIVQGAVQTQDVDTVIFSVSKLSEISSLDSEFVRQWAAGSVGEEARVKVPALRMNSIIRNYLNNESPYFLSIDVEGMDLPLLRDLDFSRYRPRFVQVEASEDYIPGNTQRIMRYMDTVGYNLVAKTEVNLIFQSSNDDHCRCAETRPGDGALASAGRRG